MVWQPPRVRPRVRVTKPCQRAGVMDHIPRARPVHGRPVTKPCQRAGVMDDMYVITYHEHEQVTKPCQRAGVMDCWPAGWKAATAARHKALSAGRCDGRPGRGRRRRARTRHKALSAGRCDGHGKARSDAGGKDVTKPCQRAGVMDMYDITYHVQDQFRHKALSAGRCDGPRAGSVRRVRVLRVTKPCQRAGVMDLPVA